MRASCLMRKLFYSQVIGSLIAGSGIEMLFSGSLLGVLAGSNYKRGWTVHGACLEALERLLFKRFVHEDPTIPDRFHDLANINKRKFRKPT